MMKDLLSYAAKLENTGGKPLPPVDKWNPEYCGEIDLIIKRDGTWFHEGTPIGRARLVRLFSTVLKREGDEYFLVTPVEKLKIIVEDVPFVGVLMNVTGEGAQQSLTFTTNVGDEVTGGPAHKMEFRKASKISAASPYIDVRSGLEARISRAVFYDLVELGERRQMDGTEMFGVWSSDMFFPFGRADEIFD